LKILCGILYKKGGDVPSMRVDEVEERLEKAKKQRESARLIRYTIWFLKNHYMELPPPMPPDWKEITEK
jgi:hypothetical protein